MKVKVYDRYRFAIPVEGVIIAKSKTNDGVQVRLETTNNPRYPVGALIWIHRAQCRATV